MPRHRTRGWNDDARSVDRPLGQDRQHGHHLRYGRGAGRLGSAVARSRKGEPEAAIQTGQATPLPTAASCEVGRGGGVRGAWGVLGEKHAAGRPDSQPVENCRHHEEPDDKPQNEKDRLPEKISEPIGDRCAVDDAANYRGHRHQDKEKGPETCAQGICDAGPNDLKGRYQRDKRKQQIRCGGCEFSLERIEWDDLLSLTSTSGVCSQYVQPSENPVFQSFWAAPSVGGSLSKAL